jgi:hypothetical protein
MRFAADYSEALEVFVYADRWNKRPSLRFSVVCEMATVQERALCVGWLFEAKSFTQTQRNDRTQFNKQPPSDYAIRDWQRRFLETGSVHDRKRSGITGVSDECVETIHASFVRSPAKSTRRASRELLLPRSTIQKVLRNTQFFKTPSGLCGQCNVVKFKTSKQCGVCLHLQLKYRQEE